jgi:hypothetical protein
MLSGMHNDWLTATLWALLTAVQAFQWYWQGRRDQQLKDKKLIDAKMNDLVDRVDDILRRNNIDPNRPSYLDRQ